MEHWEQKSFSLKARDIMNYRKNSCIVKFKHYKKKQKILRISGDDIDLKGW